VASRRPPEAGPFHAPQGVHLALSVGLPTAFSALAAFWMAGALPNLPQAVNLGYTVLTAFWASWRLRTRQGPWPRLWLWLVLTAGCYAGQSWLEGIPWPRTFALEGPHLLWFCLGLFQGQVAALWAGQLASRARLFQLIEGVPDGKPLEAVIRDYQLDADFSRGNRAVLTASLALLLVLAATLVSMTRYGLPLWSPVLFGAFVGLCLLVGVLVRTYRREMESMVYGRRWTWGEKAAPLGWSLVLAVGAGLAGWAMLGVGPWSTQLTLPEGPPQHPEPPAPALPSPPPMPENHDVWLAVLAALAERLLGLRNLLDAAAVLVRVAAFTAPWVVVAFLVWPLVRWVLSGGRDTRGLLRRWRGLIAAQWADFLSALRQWWGRPRPEPPRPLGASAARLWLRSLFRSPSPRRLVPAMVEAFLGIVAWAEPVAVYRVGETTREFLDRVAAVLPEAAADLTALRDGLDQQLFGPGLSAAEQAAFLKRAADLRSRSAFHDEPPGVS
jgi:hypothetical protein